MTTAYEPTAQPAWTPDVILGALTEQCSLYERLRATASRQRTLITGGDPNALLSLLADRQKLSTKLTEVSRRLEPVRSDWETHRRRFTEPQAAEAERLLAAIRGHLREVILSDEQDAKLLSARKQATGAALRMAHSASQALSAYRAPAREPARLNHLDEAVE